MLLEQLVTGLAAGAAYSLLAVAVVLVYTGTRTLSIAMGELGAFGFFVASRLREDGRLSPLMAGVVAILIGAAIGMLVERVVMRPLVSRPPLDGLIATLGVALTLALLELRIFGTDPQPVASPVGDGVVTIAGAPLVAPRIAALILATAVALGLFVFLRRTRFGLAMRAATSDPTVARLLGVKVGRVYLFAWGVGGALSGAAAALLAPAFGSLVPFAQTNFALRALAGAVVGGLDSLGGAIVGSLLVGVVESLVQSNVQASGASELAVLVLVLGTLLARPRGLLGTTGAA